MNSNNWQKDMYDHFFKAKTIGSKIWAEKGKAEADFVLKVLNLPAEAKILDLPCGTGRHAVQFATRGYSVTGIDISRSCIPHSGRLQTTSRRFKQVSTIPRLVIMSPHT